MYYMCFLILTFSVRLLKSSCKSTAYETHGQTMDLLNSQYISAVFLEFYFMQVTLTDWSQGNNTERAPQEKCFI